MDWSLADSAAMNTSTLPALQLPSVRTTATHGMAPSDDHTPCSSVKPVVVMECMTSPVTVELLRYSTNSEFHLCHRNASSQISILPYITYYKPIRTLLLPIIKPPAKSAKKFFVPSYELDLMVPELSSTMYKSSGIVLVHCVVF